MAGKIPLPPPDAEAEARFEKAIQRAMSVPVAQVPKPVKSKPGASKAAPKLPARKPHSHR
jgi:hypothetical protein